MNLPKSLKATVLVVGVTSILLISLFLAAFLYYVPTEENQTKGNCFILTCVVSNETCSYDTVNGNSTTTVEYPCYYATLFYELILNSHAYLSSETEVFDEILYANNYCSNYPANSTIECYYDKTDPANTLTLDKYGNLVGPIFILVILSVFSCIGIVLTILFAGHLLGLF